MEAALRSAHAPACARSVAASCACICALRLRPPAAPPTCGSTHPRLRPPAAPPSTCRSGLRHRSCSHCCAGAQGKEAAVTHCLRSFFLYNVLSNLFVFVVFLPYVSCNVWVNFCQSRVKEAPKQEAVCFLIQM